MVISKIQVSDPGPSWPSCLVCSISFWIFFQFYSYEAPGVKTCPTPRVTSWNNRKKEDRIYFVGIMTQVSDPGPSWPSCINCQSNQNSKLTK